jgi:hypothetical protein
MNNTNNIIPFPSNNILPSKTFKITTPKEAEYSVEVTKKHYIQEILNHITPIIFNHLHISGFAPENPSDQFSIKEGVFILESIKSHMYSTYGLFHPFQRLADKVLLFEGPKSDTPTIAEKVNVDFKDEK